MRPEMIISETRSTTSVRESYKFASFELDPVSRQLFEGSQPVKGAQEGLVFKLLLYLVQQWPKPISTSDLFGHLWPGESIDTDSAIEKLKNVLTRLRVVLSAKHDNRQLIQMKKGYVRLHADVTGGETKGTLRERPGHGIVYTTPESYAARLSELVSSSRKRSKLYVAVGEGDFVRAWLSRLVQPSTGMQHPAISALVLLGLNPRTASDLEKQGRLKPGFARNLHNNIESIIADTELPVSFRVWPEMPQFHGYLYQGVGLHGAWALDGRGHMHVRTPLTEMHSDRDPVRFRSMKRVFHAAAEGELSSL